MKPLSDLLEEIEPDAVNGFSGYVDREDYEQLLRVAIELAECLQNINSVTKKQFEENPMYWAAMANGASGESLTRAREIIGGESE